MISSTELIGKKIVLTPFIAQAVLMLHKMNADGVNADGFFDRNPLLHNRQYSGITIFPKYYSQNTVVIICSDTLSQQLIAEFTNLGYSSNDILLYKDIITISSNEDIIDQCDIEKYCELAPYDAVRELPYPEVKDYYIKPGRSFGGLAMLKMLKCRAGLSKQEKPVVISHFSIFVTERCNLNCKYCCNGMQYYKKRQDIPYKIIIRGLDIFLKHIDFAQSVIIAGGETLLYEPLAELINYINERYAERIGLIKVFTNGTILPSDQLIDSLVSSNAQLCISNYGKYSSKINEIVELLSRTPCKYTVINFSSWINCNQLTDYESVNMEEDWACAVKNRRQCAITTWPIIALKGDIMYPCTIAASMEECEVVPYHDSNHLLLSESTTRQDITNYWSSTYSCCAFCSTNNPINIKYYTSAEQVSEPIKRKQYSRDILSYQAEME